MGSEQSSAAPPKGTRAPPVRRGHTRAASSATESRREPSASGNNSPGASVCSDSELPYISYTVDRPIGDSPKTSTRGAPGPGKKPLLLRRQSAGVARAGVAVGAGVAGARGRRARDIVVVARHSEAAPVEHIRRLQEIPTFLPIMRGTLGLPGARDPEVLEGLDGRCWARLCARLQAHLAASAAPLAREQAALAGGLREAECEVGRLHALTVERQRANARHAERLARAHEAAHQLRRCSALLLQTLSDVEELNGLLPPDKRLEPFVWGAAPAPTAPALSTPAPAT